MCRDCGSDSMLCVAMVVRVWLLIVVVTCCVVTCVGLLFGLGFVDLCIVGVD